MTTYFKVGKTYRLRFIGDHNATVDYKVTKRSDKTVWLADAGGHEKKCRIKERLSSATSAEEYCLPMGRYSMSPALYASKEVQS